MIDIFIIDVKANYAKYEMIQDRLNSEINTLKSEKENNSKDVQHLQDTINKKNDSVYALEKANLDLRNENKMANAKLQASINNIHYLKKQIQYFQSQSRLVKFFLLILILKQQSTMVTLDSIFLLLIYYMYNLDQQCTQWNT